jgi:hypothetical protein
MGGAARGPILQAVEAAVHVRGSAIVCLPTDASHTAAAVLAVPNTTVLGFEGPQWRARTMAVPAGWRDRVRLQSGDLRTEDTARCDIVVAAERATLVSIVSLRRLSLPGWTRVLGPPAPSDGALYTIKGGAWSLAQAEGLLCDSECESAGAPAARTPHTCSPHATRSTPDAATM